MKVTENYMMRFDLVRAGRYRCCFTFGGFFVAGHGGTSKQHG
jgi:hypothetical protein